MSTPTTFGERRADAYNAMNRDQPVPAAPVVEAPKVFEPSKYQSAIFEHHRSSNQDLLVDALAGSGKTATMTKQVELLPLHLQHNTVAVAFNKSIAEVMAQRLPSSVTSSTIHALGMRCLSKAYPNNAGNKWVLSYKYDRIAQLWCKTQGINTFKPEGREISDFLGATTRIAQLTLTDVSDVQEVCNLASHFDLIVPPDLMEHLRDNGGRGDIYAQVGQIVSTLLEWGITGAPITDQDGCSYSIQECISYDDMVYLPVKLNLRLPEYQRIFIDEAQDLSAAQREFILKLRGVEGQMTWLGDVNQAIYGFSGADVKSFQTIGTRTGAARLPLSICYRCATSILDRAREIVPTIENAPWAPEGLVSDCHIDDIHKRVQPQEMIICRITAPLVQLAFSLIGQGILAKVRGRDIGEALNKVITSVEGSEYYSWPSFRTALDQYENNMRGLLRQGGEDNESKIASLEDKCESVRTVYISLCSQGRVRCAKDLKDYIKSLFSDETKGVILSTVHKAKGLEADVVYILHPELMPFPKAKKPWQKLQEQNLLYVAITRAKHELVYVGE